MVDLEAGLPGFGDDIGEALPLRIGTLTLEGLPPGRITSIRPFAGKEAAVNASLATIGLSFPPTNRFVEAGDGSVLAWAGRETAFLIGPMPVPALESGLAAVTDQSDGWATLRLSGRDCDAALARLVPVDPAEMKLGVSLRTLLGHMPLMLLRSGADSVTLLVFRSMAGTAVKELSHVMQALTARDAIKEI